VSEVDPTGPYRPGSPYSGTRELHPNDPDRGTMHIWDVWNTDDYTKCRGHRPRFVAEFGFQAPPVTSWAAVDSDGRRGRCRRSSPGAP
jgi:beta-mannosidase